MTLAVRKYYVHYLILYVYKVSHPINYYVMKTWVTI